MDERLSLIYGRRSVRSYTDSPVSEETVTELLRAAMAAPSAVKKDPWRFVVLREQASRERIAAALPHGRMIAQAPVGFAVLGDLTAVHDNQLSYLLQDCSAAIENLLLAAHGLGLGACWLGVHPREERIAAVRAALGAPAHILPVSCVAVGWPAERPAARTRYRAEYVHRERWQG